MLSDGECKFLLHAGLRVAVQFVVYGLAFSLVKHFFIHHVHILSDLVLVDLIDSVLYQFTLFSVRYEEFCIVFVSLQMIFSRCDNDLDAAHPVMIVISIK